METSEAPRIFSWKLDHLLPPSMMLSAPFAGMEETPVNGSWSGFADDLLIKDELPHRTAEATRDVILNNAASPDARLAEVRHTQNLRNLMCVPSIRRYGEQRQLTVLVPHGKILGRARRRCAFNGSNKAEIECSLQSMAVNWSALGGFLVRTLTLEPQTPDLFVPKFDRADHRTRRTRSITRRVESAGQSPDFCGLSARVSR